MLSSVVTGTGRKAANDCSMHHSARQQDGRESGGKELIDLVPEICHSDLHPVNNSVPLIAGPIALTAQTKGGWLQQLKEGNARQAVTACLFRPEPIKG